MIKYKGKFRKGYLGDFATEWWTDKDWEDHRKHVEELKASGEYGKEVEIELIMKYDQLFDKHPNPSKLPMESYKMVFLDMSNDKV